MCKNLAILAAAAAMVALPFFLRPASDNAPAEGGQRSLVIVSPHNEAIRYEFGRAFDRWHREHYGESVRVEWLAIGGTTEIARYLAAEYVSAVRAWRRREGHGWPPGSAEALFASLPPESDEPDPDERDAARRREQERRESHRALRQDFLDTDNAHAFSARVDLFFGGGQFDHDRARRSGLTVAPWPPDAPPPGLFETADGRELIPIRRSGESWRSDTYFGCVVSTFGIAHNPDLVADLGIARPPAMWDDLGDFAYFRRLGVADPTKSGSIAKAFEMIVHEQCGRAVRAAGFSPEEIDRIEAAIRRGAADAEIGGERLAVYTDALEEGWVRGVNLLRRIGANARYFTDSAGQVPIDVSLGRAAAGLAIDFFARYQAEHSLGPRGEERLRYVTPEGGSSVSADPISLLRGAQNRELAVRFIRFALSEDGQRLWTYRPGTPGGPERFALRRLPIRRDFYPSSDPEFQAAHERHRQYAAEDLSDPRINPYALAEHFVYRSRWTGTHFGVHRDLVRAMCLDASVELQRAWEAIHHAGGPEQATEAMQRFEALPDRPAPLTWESAPRILREYDRLELLREWTAFFRQQYREAARLANATRIADRSEATR